MGELEILISCLKKRMEQVNQLTKPSHLANSYNTLMHKCKSLKGHLLTRAHQEILMVEQALSHEIQQLTKDSAIPYPQNRRGESEMEKQMMAWSQAVAMVQEWEQTPQMCKQRYHDINKSEKATTDNSRFSRQLTLYFDSQPGTMTTEEIAQRERLREQLRSSYLAYQTEMQSSKPCTPSMEEQDHNLRKRRYLN